MPEITLARQAHRTMDDATRAAAREAIFGVVDGIGDEDRRKWRRFFNRLLKLEPGEIVRVVTRQERIGKFHRLHMALEARVFDAQERFDNFDRFRDWLKIGAGHVEWAPGPKGGVVPLPRSIAYAEMEQGDFEEFHRQVVNFLLTPRVAKFLWPNAAEQSARDGLADILAEFEA